LKPSPTGKGPCVALVLEYLQGKDLESKLKKEKEGIPYQDVRKLAKNMVSALLYLKEQGIIHRDIKPGNIFIDSAGRYKLGDFGFAIKVEEVAKDALKYVGTPLYMAPELLLRNGFASYASDVWSLAVVLFESYHGSVPWVASDMDTLKDRVSNMDIKGAVYDGKHLNLKHFIDATLVLDPRSRLRLSLAINHPLLQFNKTPPKLEESFAQDLKEFGLGTRTDFYLWIANKYPDRSPPTWAEFSEMYDRLYMEKKN
jgi:serine/threonine protein kinase